MTRNSSAVAVCTVTAKNCIYPENMHHYRLRFKLWSFYHFCLCLDIDLRDNDPHTVTSGHSNTEMHDMYMASIILYLIGR